MDQPVDPSPASASRFLDREASWLQFNSRVLDLAEDRGVPLLERAKYSAIFANNLDEFFMVRVASLKRRIATGAAGVTASGLSHREVMQRIWASTQELMHRHAAGFQEHLRPELAEHGIEIVDWTRLTKAEQDELYVLFRERIFPVLTPLAVDPAHPFPYISGLSLNLAVQVRNPVSQHEHFARVKVPPLLPRFIEVAEQRYVPLEQVIAAHLPHLFNGMEVLGCHAFRVTRNEDVEIDGEDSQNLLETLERELMRRRFGPAVRLEVEESIDPGVLELLVRELAVGEAEILRLPAPLDLTGLFAVAGEDRPELKYPPFAAAVHQDLAEFESGAGIDVFAAMRQHDILLHHPYDSFSTSVQAFLEQAAADPDVRAIKQTLYRTSGDSPIVDALVDAAEAGKEVLVLVEIKARFDEHANIAWARTLEQAGCHVVYGLMGLKTHCKLSLVVRQEGNRLRRYAHIGTGNYNPKTARQYEDLGLLTCDPQVGEDLTHLFNRLSGYSRTTSYRRLMTAPHGMRESLIEKIENEHKKALSGRRALARTARIRMKMNSLVDETVIDALYAASQAGVKIDLVVRGMCALRPGVPGLSENIRVRSVLGRFLEHSRVYVFGDDVSVPAGARSTPEPAQVWIGSADMMHRNLDRRVEALVRIGDPAHRSTLIELIDSVFAEDAVCWALGPDGEWTRRTPPEGVAARDVQKALIEARNQQSAARRARMG
ncbi:RNA degradosome polyphosphate kinase [Actinospica robiniae]|uniref:RNA degradosome polyphosphate kinase n=1 Tax=Actinospica robiniae TaxID=304901 RepID=UPI0006879DF1|nr:RNA degradosome polyphosphate kinase [Actinospica robiniae]